MRIFYQQDPKCSKIIWILFSLVLVSPPSTQLLPLFPECFAFVSVHRPALRLLTSVRKERGGDWFKSLEVGVKEILGILG